jgi:hypothetical protein
MMGLFKETVTHKYGSTKTTKVTNRSTGKSKSVITKVGKRVSKSGLSKSKRK